MTSLWVRASCSSTAKPKQLRPAQRWIDVRLVELPKAQRFVLQGRVNAEVRSGVAPTALAIDNPRTGHPYPHRPADAP
jgi:hypothetical protein